MIWLRPLGIDDDNRAIMLLTYFPDASDNSKANILLCNVHVQATCPAQVIKSEELCHQNRLISEPQCSVCHESHSLHRDVLLLKAGIR